MIEHRVTIARHAVERAPGRLVSVGLGSCVVIAIHDARAQVGALAHVLLPHATASAHGGAGEHPARYADTAVPLDRKSTRLNSSHSDRSRMPSSA